VSVATLTDKIRVFVNTSCMIRDELDCCGNPEYTVQRPRETALLELLRSRWFHIDPGQFSKHVLGPSESLRTDIFDKEINGDVYHSMLRLERIVDEG